MIVDNAGVPVLSLPGSRRRTHRRSGGGPVIGCADACMKEVAAARPESAELMHEIFPYALIIAMIF